MAGLERGGLSLALGETFGEDDAKEVGHEKKEKFHGTMCLLVFGLLFLLANDGAALDGPKVTAALETHRSDETLDLRTSKKVRRSHNNKQDRIATHAFL